MAGPETPGLLEAYGAQAEFDDKPKDECGVFVVIAPGEPVAEIAVAGIMGLQNRGQSAAGVMYKHPELGVIGHKGLGLVREAIPEMFDGSRISYSGPPSPGIKVALGQVRYSTDASDSVHGAQPFKGDRSNSIFGTNGNVPRVETAADHFGIDVSQGVTDSHKLSILTDALAEELGGIAPALYTALPYVNGAYCITMSDGERVYAARDPWGYHPLAIGRLKNGSGYMVASEDAVFESVGAEFVRDVMPGEIVVLDEQGEIASQQIDRQAKPSRCMYEYLYTGRPDSTFDGLPVTEVRLEAGRMAARALLTRGIEVDGIIAMPDSGTAAGYGFAEESQLPFIYGVYKNAFAGRSFQQRGEARDETLSDKARPIRSQVKGKRLVVVDDSQIKGNSNSVNVGKLKAAGAAEVHVVIAASRYEYECFMGMDTGNPDELIAARMSDDEMCDYLGADSVTYLTPEETQEVFDRVAKRYQVDEYGICTSCVTGEYPFPVPSRSSQTSKAGAVALGMPKVRITNSGLTPAGV